MRGAGIGQLVRVTPLSALKSIRSLKRSGWRRSESFAAIRGEALDTIQCQKANPAKLEDGDQKKLFEGVEASRSSRKLLFRKLEALVSSSPRYSPVRRV